MRKGRFLAVAMRTSAACSGDKKGRIRATRRFPFRMHMICMKWSSLGLARRGERCWALSWEQPRERGARVGTPQPAPTSETSLGREKQQGNDTPNPNLGLSDGLGRTRPVSPSQRDPALPRQEVRQEATDLKRLPETGWDAGHGADGHPASVRTDPIRSSQAAGMEVVTRW